MPTIYKIPGQNLEYTLPAVNEIFKQRGNTGGEAFVLTPQGRQIINFNELGKLTERGKTTTNGWELEGLGREYFRQQTGINFDSLPEYNDLSKLERLGFKNIGTLTDLSSLKNLGPKINDTYSQVANPTNPHGYALEKNGQNIFTSASLSQTLANAQKENPQYTNDQVDTIKAYQMGTGGPTFNPDGSLKSTGAVPDSLLTATGIKPAQGTAIAQSVNQGGQGSSTQGGGVLNEGNSGSGSGGNTSGGTKFTSDQQKQIQNTQTAQDQALQTILNDPNLTDDQKEALKQMFGAISANDEERKKRLEAAFEAAGKISDPYFKQQLRLVNDELQRGFGSLDEDAMYKEKTMKNQLDDLRASTQSQGDYMDFQQNQELKKLDSYLTTQLEDTRQTLASRGFSDSTKRATAETLLKDSVGSLRESTNRQFAYNKENAQRNLVGAERDYRGELERLAQLTSRGKTATGREAESKVGSSNLPGLPGLTPLGDIAGSIPQQNLMDKLNATNSFVN